MKSKYRPVKVEIGCPSRVGDEFEAWLREHLHQRANMHRTDNAGCTVFLFWPTRSEYFYISLFLGMKSEELLCEGTEINSNININRE